MADKSSKVLIVLLAVSICINAYCLISINKLAEAIEDGDALAIDILNRLNSLSGRLNSVSGDISALNREKEWVLNREFTVDIANSSAGAIYLDLDFTLQEAEEGAEAQVYFRGEDSREWTAVPAEPLGCNSYRARLLITGERGLRYKIQVDNRVTAEANIPSQYYVSEPIIPELAGVSMGDHRQLDLILESYGLNFNLPDVISLKYYKGARLVRTQVLYSAGDSRVINESEPPWYGPHPLELDDDITSVDLEVIYQDGSVDEGEIWPEYEYMENIKNRY